MPKKDFNLQALPLRALAAFAARCARRVLPLYKSPDNAQVFRKIVTTQIQIADDLAEGRKINEDHALRAEFLPPATNTAAEYAAESASKAALLVSSSVSGRHDEASVCAGDAFRLGEAAIMAVNPDDAKLFSLSTTRDLQILVNLKLGTFPDLGDFINTSEQGPLGKLWTDDGVPKWFQS